MKFQLVIAVWGEAYTECMLRVTLPMLLSGGNIPSLPNLSSSDLTFYCRPEDEERIGQAPVVKELRKLLEVRFSHIDVSKKVSKYNVMAKAHWAAAMRARAEGAHCIMLGPDYVIADGSLASVGRLAAAGKHAVMTVGPRLKQETLLTVLGDADQNALTISPRELTRLALDHLHPETLSFFVDSPKFTRRPSICLWKIEGEGFLARNFHLHPLMIDFSAVSSGKDLDFLLAHSVDGHFLGQAMGRWSGIHVETDSDNIFICSLAPSKTSHSRLGSRLSAQETVRAMAFHPQVNPLHRSFFMQAIRVHAQDLDERWDKLEEDSGRWAYEALEVGSNSSGARVISEATVSKWSVTRDKVLRKFSKITRGLAK